MNGGDFALKCIIKNQKRSNISKERYILKQFHSEKSSKTQANKRAKSKKKTVSYTYHLVKKRFNLTLKVFHPMRFINKNLLAQQK